MVDMKRALLAATLTAAVGYAGSALAESKKSSAPGQTGANPGQTFNSQQDLNPDAALSPGQQFKQDRVLIPNTPAPGQGVKNWGNTKPQ